MKTTIEELLEAGFTPSMAIECGNKEAIRIYRKHGELRIDPEMALGFSMKGRKQLPYPEGYKTKFISQILRMLRIWIWLYTPSSWKKRNWIL